MGDSEGQEGVQVLWVVRHGDRMDNFDPTWRKQVAHHEDTPLSPLGHEQAQEVAQSILAAGCPVHHILASPFLRAMQTALPLAEQSGTPMKLEDSVWETGCRRPPPSHMDQGFPIDETHGSYFTPECGERPADFRPRLARSAEGVLKRFPFELGNVAIFSHADPVAYLVAELTDVDPALLGPVTVAVIFRLERRRDEAKFTLVNNADISHLTSFGNTEPCHPVHAFHDWCRLFGELREQELVSPDFRWPPTGDNMTRLKVAWTARYQALLLRGPSEVDVRPSSPKKVKFECPRCAIVSFVSCDLYYSAPFTHNIKCWKCKTKFKLREISKESTAVTRLWQTCATTVTPL
jgi:broad specificity phosphatase PhoE